MMTLTVRAVLRRGIMAIALSSPVIHGAALTNNGWAGKLDGVKSWRLMNTANGLTPNQCWNAVSSTPNGDAYIVGCDHSTNTALYRLNAATEILSYVGDARSASEAVGNWLSTETAQKFHAPPVFYHGRTYNATCDFSGSDSGWLKARGFHWYDYDIGANTFNDLSATVPGGVVAPHRSIFATVLDSANGRIYAASNPFGELYRYDIAANVTVDLGRPAAVTDTFPNGPYCLWMDSRNRVYFNYGNAKYKGKVYYYDESSGFGELTPFIGQDSAEGLSFGQWSPDHTTFYLSDYQSHFYRFHDADRTFEYIGQLQVAPEFQANSYATYIMSRVFQVSADEQVIYLANEREDFNSHNFSLFEWNIPAKSGRRLCGLVQADDSVGYQSMRFHAGFSTWDTLGRFFFGSFSMSWDGGNTILTRLDPVRLKVAQGLLPRLVTVGITASHDTIQVHRDPSDTGALEVVIRASGQLSDNRQYQGFAKVMIPAQSSSVTVDPSHFALAAGLAWKNAQLSVIPSGNTYVVGAGSGSASYNLAAVPHLPANGNHGYRMQKGEKGATVVAFDKADTFSLTVFNLHGMVIGRCFGRSSTVTIPAAAGLEVGFATVKRQDGEAVMLKLVR